MRHYHLAAGLAPRGASSAPKYQRRRPAAPTSKRRPRSFTEAQHACLCGETSVASAQHKHACWAERTTALGKQSRAKLNRGGTPQHDRLGKLPARLLSLVIRYFMRSI